MSGLCDGRIVVITGAGRGIGRGHALEFARQGAKVVVNDIGASIDGTGSSDGPAGEVVDAIRAMGGEAVANGDDVADWDGAERLVRTAIDTFGGLDVVVNNAGFLSMGLAETATDAQLLAQLDVNIVGPHRVLRATLPGMRARGAGLVLHVSSSLGRLIYPAMGTYCASKAGLEALADAYRFELKPLGIDSVIIQPGAFPT
ncbi:MAG: SDR family NAD(P)-dependent oxidoreductase, partial [Acidimicrobiales bacterium]|nr:SDR family NAD(P)-dependent oxidoreductase [Acidimicrobiales bacterium]